MKIYSFYNNKGGVGKTTLCQNTACLYAKTNPEKQVLVIDMCPQANISQFLLGGGHKGYQQNQNLQKLSTRKNIVGFVDWLLKGNSAFTSSPTTYSVQPKKYNPAIPDNLFLIAGDSFLESFSLALNYAVINPANMKAWFEYMTAIRRLCEIEFRSEEYKDLIVFIDCNPSFSIYTQMALVSSDQLIIPMMADFSSLEGVRGIISLLYGIYPSVAEQHYAENIVTFHKKAQEFKVKLPTIFEFIFNNFTTKAGIATAFQSIKNELIEFSFNQYKKNPQIFYPTNAPIVSSSEIENIFFSNVKDFHTAGKVSASLGLPLCEINNYRSPFIMPDGERVTLTYDQYSDSIDNIKRLTKKVY